jgi:hypothetical protein
VGHQELVAFAQEKVNLPRENAAKYRAQVQRLRDKLTNYLAEHPDFSLQRMLLSGSLAKGTALRSLNDVDVAAYISGAEAPSDVGELIRYLVERLRTAFPNFSADQVVPQTYSVRVSFRGTGLDVDVVPILFDGDPSGRGLLVSQDDGSFLLTSIDEHLAFASKRRQAHEVDWAQVVRLVKYWVWNRKREDPGFRCKSFMVELVLAHLSDQGLEFSDYVEALQHFFTYVIRSALEDPITFCDYYPAGSAALSGEPIEIIDPVNPENNVPRLYTDLDRLTIVERAEEAGDAIDAAITAPTKGQTIQYWRKVFGPSFSA